MKIALPLAAALLLSAVLPAYAWHNFFDDAVRTRHSDYRTRYSYHHHVYRHHYHRGRCVGLASGTAHRRCGTRSGGPVGGLH